MFFEAPIDLLSYLSLNRTKLTNCRLISLDGLKQQTFFQILNNALKDLKANGRDIESITLCVDNDSAGKEFIDKLQKYELQDTLNTTQALYEKKYVTYPRTGSQYIANDSELPALLEKHSGHEWVNKIISKGYKIESSFVDPSKVTDHQNQLMLI
ncbi:DNA topoisomerase [Neobacillus sp. NPDC097160]|uniref:DNA topoisomerase n=1 Tax=Neobacillus sp. NPDC097160 TaxID=3364298 RepID=UPI00381E6C03